MEELGGMSLQLIAEIIIMNFHLAGVAPLITVPVIMRMRVTYFIRGTHIMLLFFCLIPFNCNVPPWGYLNELLDRFQCVQANETQQTGAAGWSMTIHLL